MVNWFLVAVNLCCSYVAFFVHPHNPAMMFMGSVSVLLALTIAGCELYDALNSSSDK